jgi:Tfp pilus assembly protein PilO
MKFDSEATKKYALQVKRLAAEHAVVLLVLFFALVIGYVVTQTSELSSVEPTEDKITETKLSNSASQIDQDALDVLEQLTGRNITLESLFVERRDNPFNE